MATKKKSEDLIDAIASEVDKSQTYNPLLIALRENDKKNLFKANVNTVFHKTGFHLFDYYFGSVINIHDKLGKLIGQEARVGQAAGTFNLIVGNTGSGKAQPISTKIPSPMSNNGYIKMGDIKVGDIIFGSGGNPIAVEGVYPQGKQAIYKVIFNDGRTALCTEDHLWSIIIHETGGITTFSHKETYTVLSLKDIMNNMSQNKNISIPCLSMPVQYNHQITPIDPYSFGTHILDDKYNINEIPDIYLYNDEETRFNVLKGLLDNKVIPGDYVHLKIKNNKLASQINELLHSLAYKTKVFIQNDGIIIAFDHANPYYPECNRLFIDKIEFSHMEEAQCIKVSAKDQLYVTEDFIVTHNTTLASQIAANIIRQYKYSNVIHYDCENRFDASRCETITKLPSSYFNGINGAERYLIKTGMVGLDTIQEMIVKTYVNKMKLKDQLLVSTGFKDEFGNDVKVLQPTIIIIDSITTVLNETFNPNNAKEATDAEKMRGNTEGARDAKTLKGFFKDIIPLCKEANIIIYGINHINTNMSMNAFTPVAKQQNFLKQDEIIPGGKTMIYYPFNIIKLTARPSDDFTEETDGFAGHIVMVEPIKSSSNQSGNNSKGVSFEMVFNFQQGFDPLRTMILYGRDNGFIEGNKPRMKFKNDDSFTFAWKNLNQERKDKPIWQNIKQFIIPTLDKHLSFIDPSEQEFDDNILDY